MVATFKRLQLQPTPKCSVHVIHVIDFTVMMARMVFMLCILNCFWFFSASAKLRLSKTLGDGMVLQRAPAAATVWGFASAGSVVHTTFGGQTHTTTTDATGVWRQVLPPTPATKSEQMIVFNSSEGNAHLSVLFGEVFLCSVRVCVCVCVCVCLSVRMCVSLRAR